MKRAWFLIISLPLTLAVRIAKEFAEIGRVQEERAGHRNRKVTSVHREDQRRPWWAREEDAAGGNQGGLPNAAREHRIGVVVFEVGTLLKPLMDAPYIMSRTLDVVSFQARDDEAAGLFSIEKLLVSPDGTFGYISANYFGEGFHDRYRTPFSSNELLAVSSDGETVLEYSGVPGHAYTLRHLQSGLSRPLDAAEIVYAIHRDGMFSPSGDKVAVVAFLGDWELEARIWIWSAISRKLLHHGRVRFFREPGERRLPIFSFDDERVALCDGSENPGHLLVARGCDESLEGHRAVCELIPEEQFGSCEDVFLRHGLNLHVQDAYGNATKLISVARWDGGGTPRYARVQVFGVDAHNLRERWRGRFSPDGQKVVVWQEVEIWHEWYTGPAYVWQFANTDVPDLIWIPWERDDLGSAWTMAFTADSAWLVAGGAGDEMLRFYDMGGCWAAAHPTLSDVMAIAVSQERGSWLE